MFISGASPHVPVERSCRLFTGQIRLSTGRIHPFALQLLYRCLPILGSGLMLLLLLKKGQYFTLVNQKVRRQISNLSILKSFLMPLSCHIIPALSTGIKALFNDNILKKNKQKKQVLSSSNNLPVSKITSSSACQCFTSKAQI